MKKPTLLLMAALLATALPLRGTDYRKLSGHVRSIVATEEHRVASARATARGQTPFLAASADTAATERLLTAFVQIAPDVADAVWRQYGCRPYSQVADVAIVGIPVSRLGDLSDHASVRRIEANPSGYATMDTTRYIVGTDKLQPDVPTGAGTATLPLTGTAFTGEGVVVGVMDIGFDLTHPNFYDPSGTRYRISAFWDQLSKDTVGSTLAVGRDYRGHEAVLAHERSYDGLRQTHGTHTLGIAAGGGYNSAYRGVAYDADLCLVSNAVTDDIELIDAADLDKFTTAVDALGFKYIFDYADAVGKPCVVSFSEGYPPLLDEEDVLYAYYLFSLLRPGHVIVASAGNESVAYCYAEKKVGEEAAGAFINTSRPKAMYRIKADKGADLSVYAYANYAADSIPSDTLHFADADMLHGYLMTDTLFLGSDTCAVSVDRYCSYFGNDTIYSVYLTANRPFTTMPRIALVMEGADSHAELYGSTTNGLNTYAKDLRWNAVQMGHNIHAPACFPSTICVGATAHRLGFVNYLGEYKDYSQGRTKGKLSPYSSMGPAMTSFQKPEVTAPGDNVISSYSSYYIEANPQARDLSSDVEHFDFQGRTYAWNANSGTSMSTPVVAGVIALWLQANPRLTTDDVRDILSRTCNHPADTLSYPNDAYGYGEIDAYRGLLEVLQADRIAAVSPRQPLAAGVRVDGRQLYVDAPAGARLTVDIYDLNGRRLYHTGRESHPISLDGWKGGLYIVQLNGDSPSLTGSVVVRL